MSNIAQFKLSESLAQTASNSLAQLVQTLNKNFGYIAYGGNDEAWYIEIIDGKKDWNVRSEMRKRAEDVLEIIEVKSYSLAGTAPHDPMSGGWRGRSTVNAIEFIAIDPKSGAQRHFKFSYF